MSGTAQPGIFRPWAAVKQPNRSRHRSNRSHHPQQHQQQQPVQSPSPPASLVGAVAELVQQHSADNSQRKSNICMLESLNIELVHFDKRCKWCKFFSIF
jgi:hypothetical protein